MKQVLVSCSSLSIMLVSSVLEREETCFCTRLEELYQAGIETLVDVSGPFVFAKL